MKSLTLFLLLTSLILSPPAEAQRRYYTDEEVALAIKVALQSQGHNVRSVQIIDGRLKGGDRSILMAYIARAGTETEQLQELMKIGGSGWVASTQFGANIDGTLVVVGNTIGQALAMGAIGTEDSTRFMQSHDGVNYLKHWQLTLLAPDFLPMTAKAFDWKKLAMRPFLPNEPEKPDAPSYIWCSRTVGRDDRLFAKCMKDEGASMGRIAGLTVHPSILDYCQRIREGVPSQVEDCLRTHNALGDLSQILKDKQE